MLLLELPAEVWETPNLEVSVTNVEELKRDERFNRQEAETLFVFNTLQRGKTNVTKL